MVSWLRTGSILTLAGALQAFASGLDLDSLVHMGLRNNADLLASGLEAEIAARDTLAAVSSNPSLAVDALHNLDDPGKPKAGVKISQEFHPGVRSGLYRASQANLATKKEWQKARELDLARDIRSLYFSWQILNRKKEFQKEVQNRWEKLSRLASAKVAEGKISEVEEAQARLNYAEAKQSGIETRSEMEALEKRLAYAVGREELPDSIAPLLPDSLPAIPSLETLWSFASGENPDLKAMDREIAFQKAQTDLERSRKNPSFAVSLGYEKETDGGNLIGGGVELPLPLFNRNQAGISRSRASLREAELKRNAAEKRLKSETAEMRAKLLKLAERFGNYQNEIRELSRKQMSLSEKGFQQGMLGIFDLSRVQEESLHRDLEALDMLAEFYQLWNQLGRNVGGRIW